MKTSDIIHSEQGAIVILAASSLLAGVILAAIVIDLGWYFMAQAELKRAADAAALAAGKELGRIYMNQANFAAQQTYSLQSTDETQIKNAAKQFGNQNQNLVAGRSIIVLDNEIEIGIWDEATNVFTPNLNPPNAVRITVRKDSTANGPLQTFLAGLVGWPSFDMRSAMSVVALTPLNLVPPSDFVPPGQLRFPLGIDADWPGLSTCSGVGVWDPQQVTPYFAWHVFGGPQSDLPLLASGAIPVPQVVANPVPATVTGGITTFTFWSTMTASQVASVAQIFNANAPGGFPAVWETLVPVFQANGGTPPASGGQTLQIEGFVSVQIGCQSPSPAGGCLQPIYTVQQSCGVVATGRSGGGADFGTRGSIPVLVG